MVRRFRHIQIIYTLAAVVVVGLFIAANPLKFVNVGNAQGDACPSNVEAAIAATGSLCDGTPGNNACYGHSLVDADVREMPEEMFDRPGDRIELTLIDSLRLSAMNIEEGTWGVAQMHLKAPATASTLQSINMLLFGDVSLTSTGDTPIHIEAMTVDLDENINVRALPNTESYVSVALEPNTVVTATGRTEDSSWIRVESTDDSYIGWVTTEFVTTEDDISNLSVVSSNDTYYGSMQSYYFSSTSSGLDCGSLPVDGLILQTPEGPAQVKVYINEVSIDLLPSSTGNTLFLQAEQAGDMTVNVLEGHAYIEANGTGEVAVAGSQVTVPLSENLSPHGAVTAPAPYSPNSFATMASYFPNQSVVVAAPATEDEIAAANVFARSIQNEIEAESLGNSLSDSGSSEATGSVDTPTSRNDDDDDDDENSSTSSNDNSGSTSNNDPGSSNNNNDDNGNNDDRDNDDDDDDNGKVKGNDDDDDNGSDGGVNPGNQGNGTPIEIDTTGDAVAPEQPIVIEGTE